jgi:hypothetical protein
MIYIVNADIEVEATNAMAAETLVLDMLEKMDENFYASIIEVKEVNGV